MKLSTQSFVNKNTEHLTSNPSSSVISSSRTSFSLTVIIVSLFLLSTPSALLGQTLFTYGKHQVSKDEFVRAYNKNNTDSSSNRMSVAEYLELFARFKLKVQDAKDAGLDTTLQQKNEVQSFRYQLAENFLKEDASIDLLVNEAFKRSLKDIHLSHIFVPVLVSSTPEAIDSARKKIDAAYARLQKGELFESVANDYMSRSLGYITAFVLPYNIESIAYATPVGNFTKAFQTRSGFHILRIDSERKAVGKLRAAQILLAYPPETTDAIKGILSRRADSIYNALMKGADFAEFVQRFSDDHLTLQTAGEMPAFGVGQYDTAFERAAFALAKDGDISRPVNTSFGFHIIKRLQRIPVVEDSSNDDWKEVIRERVLQSDRMEVAHQRLIQNIRQIIQKDASDADLASDSSVLEFYRQNLEKYNEDFGEQLAEFSEGNLLFTIMQQKVWDAAVADTTGLIAYYEKNRQKYKWEKSADALIVTSIIADSTENIMQAVRNNPRAWRELAENSNGIVQTDSGRFELGQIPVVERTNFAERLVTAPVTNDQDGSQTFSYIIRLYEEGEPKKFSDARGSVINDYQSFLEEKWIADLKKKYPVRVNKKVLAQIERSK